MIKKRYFFIVSLFLIGVSILLSSLVSADVVKDKCTAADEGAKCWANRQVGEGLIVRQGLCESSKCVIEFGMSGNLGIAYGSVKDGWKFASLSDTITVNENGKDITKKRLFIVPGHITLKEANGKGKDFWAGYYKSSPPPIFTDPPTNTEPLQPTSPWRPWINDKGEKDGWAWDIFHPRSYLDAKGIPVTAPKDNSELPVTWQTSVKAESDNILPESIFRGKADSSVLLCPVGDFPLVKDGVITAKMEYASTGGEILINIKKASMIISTDGTCSPSLDINVKLISIGGATMGGLKDNKKDMESLNIIVGEGENQFNLLNFIFNDMLDKYDLGKYFTTTDIDIEITIEAVPGESNKFIGKITAEGEQSKDGNKLKDISEHREKITDIEEVVSVINKIISSVKGGGKVDLTLPWPPNTDAAKKWKSDWYADDVRDLGGGVTEYWKLSSGEKKAVEKISSSEFEGEPATKTERSVYIKHDHPNPVFKKTESENYGSYETNEPYFKAFYNLFVTKYYIKFNLLKHSINSIFKKDENGWIAHTIINADVSISTVIDTKELKKGKDMALFNCCPLTKKIIDDAINANSPAITAETSSNSVWLFRESDGFKYEGDAYQFSPKYNFNVPVEVVADYRFSNPTYIKYQDDFLNSCKYNVLDSISKTIGQEGGVISLGQITQTIPEGAVSQPTEFTLKKLDLTDCGVCFNNVKDSGEEGIDCGGICSPYRQCTSSCYDGIQNGDESGIDCGGSCVIDSPSQSKELCGVDQNKDCKVNQCQSCTQNSQCNLEGCGNGGNFCYNGGCACSGTCGDGICEPLELEANYCPNDCFIKKLDFNPQATLVDIVNKWKQDEMSLQETLYATRAYTTN